MHKKELKAIIGFLHSALERIISLYGDIYYPFIKKSGKNLVFAMTKKIIPEFWRNQEIPENFWKTYKQVKLDLLQIYYLFLILFQNFATPSPDQPPFNLTWHIMFNKPKYNIYSFLGFA